VIYDVEHAKPHTAVEVVPFEDADELGFVGMLKVEAA
jgi:hypothetical protein